MGLTIQFLEAAENDVIRAMPGEYASAATGMSFVDSLPRILPFQAPWTRVLTAQAGQWTALTNNAIGGGDGTAPGPAVSRALGVRCVVATHAPRYGPGHAQTQLEIFGPDGSPPLMVVRSLSATATDGRWEWWELGEAQPFEETERYAARLKRDRFDRPMLLRYLAALGVPTTGDGFGLAHLHQTERGWPSREQTLAEARLT